MTGVVTLYHKTDGAAEFASAYVADVLQHKDEWSDKPWPEPAVEAPAAGRRRKADEPAEMTVEKVEE